MIMKRSFLFDLKEYIRNTPDQTFQAAGLSREALLGDEEKLESLWTLYQKNVEEYDCDPWYAYGDALKTAYGIAYMPDPEI